MWLTSQESQHEVSEPRINPFRPPSPTPEPQPIIPTPQPTPTRNQRGRGASTAGHSRSTRANPVVENVNNDGGAVLSSSNDSDSDKDSQPPVRY
jgi:hypothetical protein